MGREAMAKVRWGGKEAHGKALLEAEQVVFRAPEFRLTINLADVTGAAAEHGTMTLRWTAAGKAQEATFGLGDDAAPWAERIRTPKPLIDKLGIKPGARVVVLGVRDEDLLADIHERTQDVATRATSGADVILFLAETRKRLDKLPDLARAIKPDGAVWVVHPKGREDLKDVDVIAAGKAAGLVDNKSCRVSATHSALRLVVPLAQRGKPR
jgi:hypothetical protein